ncbi:vWA domain-containing protein [Sutterella sp.]|uniref:vWA domain-containing protein n=1 Tax=Sutterella sp. TaxID=1981025 RepID=UPI003FD85DEF
MRTQNNNFLKSLPIVAGTLGRKLGVRVVLGSKAHTNGHWIELPLDLNERKISREELLGFLVHEASHVRYTDMGAVFGVARVHPLEFSLMNALEDARIEKLITADYAGARYLLDEAHRPCVEKFLDAKWRPHPAAAVALYVLAHAELTYVSTDYVRALHEVTRKWCTKFFGLSLLKEIDRELEGFTSVKQTSDVHHMATRLMKIIIKTMQKDQAAASNGSNCSDPSSSEPPSGGQNDAGKGNEKAEGQANDQSEGQSEGEADGETDGQSEGQSDGETDPSNASQGATEDQNPSGEPSASKRLKALLKAVKATKKQLNDVDLNRQLLERIEEATDADPANGLCNDSSEMMVVAAPTPCPVDALSPTARVEKHEVGTDRIKMAKANSARARRALTGIIQAKTRSATYTANTGRRINASLLSRLATGSPRIFTRRTEGKDVETSVSILLDISGSMKRDGRFDAAISSALALLTALQSVPKVKAGLSVFPGMAGVFPVMSGSSPCETVVPIGSAIEQHAAAIGMLWPMGTSTPLAAALTRTAFELSSRKEARKVIIVLTDGDIEGDAHVLIQRLRSSGLVVGGIGICLRGMGRDFFKESFPDYACLNNMDQLQQVLLDLSRKLILNG